MANRPPTSTRERVQANLARLIDARAAKAKRDRGEVRAEVAVAAKIGSDSMTPAQRGANLGRIEAGTKGVSLDRLDAIAAALGVDIVELVREPR